MYNESYQTLREAVARAEILAFAAETDIQREAVQRELTRAQNALHSAFAESSPAEQDQLVYMQTQLQNLSDMSMYT